MFGPIFLGAILIQEIQDDAAHALTGTFARADTSTVRRHLAALNSKEIADALNAHPDWKLSVNGHTDNVGGATYNIGLSNRRAAAVKQALVDHYNITADRLSTAGFGMGQPIETNDTPEGRARNRRVELIKR